MTPAVYNLDPQLRGRAIWAMARYGRASVAAQTGAGALKRVNKEIDRMQKLEARTAHVDAARRALAMRRAAQFPSRPPTGHSATESIKTVVLPARIGRISQATKNAQAARDARN